MSDTSRRVSVELELEDWETLIGVNEERGGDVGDVAEKIKAQMPTPVPTGLGAVVEAYNLTHHAVYVLCALDTEYQFGWRPLDGSRWVHGTELRVVRVLSEGTPWPA